MRQEFLGERREELRLLDAVVSEGASKIEKLKRDALPDRAELRKYASIVLKGVQAVAPGVGVLILLVALAISTSFNAPYMLRILLLLSFVFSFSLWAARDLVPEKTDTAVMHEQIGFGAASGILAIGVAGSFIMRDANLWLFAALAALILLKCLLLAYRRGNLDLKQSVKSF